MPPIPLPPELLTLSKAELGEAYEAATAFALALTKNRPLADEIVSDMFEKLLTTRRWDPSKKTLLEHVFASVRSVRSNRFTSKADDHEAEAAEGHQREEVGMQGASPETKLLEHAAETAAEEQAMSELDALAQSVAEHPLAPKVLTCRRAGTTKASDIAAELGVPTSQVYLANDVLRDHLKKLRARRKPEEGEEP